VDEGPISSELIVADVAITLDLKDVSSTMRT